MLDTKVGIEEKMDPTEVARQGYEAMLAGEGLIITGWKNKMKAAMRLVLPAERPRFFVVGSLVGVLVAGRAKCLKVIGFCDGVGSGGPTIAGMYITNSLGVHSSGARGQAIPLSMRGHEWPAPARKPNTLPSRSLNDPNRPHFMSTGGSPISMPRRLSSS